MVRWCRKANKLCLVIYDPGPGKYFDIAEVIIPVNIIDGTIGFS